MELRELETEELRQNFHQREAFSKRAVLFDLIAGTVAGITSTFAGYPLDLLKFRQQMAPNQGIRECARRVHMEGGIPAFFKGVWSPALGNIPINALVFATNGLFKKYFEHQDAKVKLTENQKLFIAGSLGGFVSLIAFVPSELIKIRIQDNHV